LAFSVVASERLPPPDSRKREGRDAKCIAVVMHPVQGGSAVIETSRVGISTQRAAAVSKSTPITTTPIYAIASRNLT
jgi:hypothetical protein